MLADLEPRLARLEALRGKARNAAAWRYGILGAIAVATFAAMTVAAMAGTLAAAWLFPDVLRPRPWAAIPIFLLCAAAPIVPGAIAAFVAYRRVGRSWQADYERQFLDQVVQPLAHAAVPFARVTTGEGIPAARYQASALFPKPVEVDDRFRLDGAARGVAWSAADTEATTLEQSWEGEVRNVWMRGLFAWIEAPVDAGTPVLIYDRRVFAAGGGALTHWFLRRPDVARGSTGDAAFDQAFVACVALTESRVPDIGAALRAAFIDLRQRTGMPVIGSCSRAGVALCLYDPNRRLFEARLLAANDAGELRREAGALAAVADVATRIAATHRAPRVLPPSG